MRRALLATAAALLLGCAVRRGVATSPGGTGDPVGTYKLVLEDRDGASRRARLVLWAAPPDRLHAEIVLPVGGVRYTLDAGGGRACVVDVAEGVAYAGADGALAVEALTGARVTVPQAVAALLTGLSPDGWDVERAGDPAGELPARIRLRGGGRTITLIREKVERALATGTLGTGVPRTGIPVRPLVELQLSERPGA